MFVISKTLGSFSSAHRLQNYNGLCEGLHGHNYRLTIEISGNFLNDKQMLIDFKVFDEFWEHVKRKFDHGCILEAGDPLIDSLKKAKTKIHYLPYPPTTEIIANFLMDDLTQMINLDGFVKTIILEETDKCRVRLTK